MTITLETTDCLHCGSADHRPILEASDFLTDSDIRFPVVSCNTCGLMYLRRRPNRADIGLFYPETYIPHTPNRADGGDVPPIWTTGNGIKRLVTRHALNKWYGYPAKWNGASPGRVRGRGQHYLPRYRNIPFFVQSGTLLELGCAAGIYLRRMQQLGWDVTGIEPSAGARQQAQQKGITKLFASLEEARFPAASFDVVTTWQVIEHMHDPLATLRELKRVTKPGGTLLLSTINVDTPERWLTGQYWGGWEIPRHLVFFSTRSLRAMVEKAGWRIQSISYQTSPNAIIHGIDRWIKTRWPRSHAAWAGRRINVRSATMQRLFWPLSIFFALARCSGRINLIAYPEP